MEMSSDQIFHCPPPSMIMDSRWRTNIDPAPNCPRCASSNTKFCYYNNYSLSQPRYFCKGCRRYWTKGGSLRNVPVGGGCRKSRRSRSSKALSSSLNTASASQNGSPNSSDCSQESGGPDIDMAAVFANFLNNNDQGNVSDEVNDSNNTSSEASHDSFASSSYGVENGSKSHQFTDEDILGQTFQQVMEPVARLDCTQLQEEGSAQGFINPDLASFSDIIEDVFWSDDSNISDLTWQPASQTHDFDSPLPPVDQSNISTNLFSSDNWSYFDNTEF